jgi:hypothetical protein
MTREEHLLVILAEECAEISKEAAKALRFGLEHVGPGQNLTNAEKIKNEVADFTAVLTMLKLRHVPLVFEAQIEDKMRKVEHFLEYSKQCGTLD